MPLKRRLLANFLVISMSEGSLRRPSVLSEGSYVQSVKLINPLLGTRRSWAWIRAEREPKESEFIAHFNETIL